MTIDAEGTLFFSNTTTMLIYRCLKGSKSFEVYAGITSPKNPPSLNDAKRENAHFGMISSIDCSTSTSQLWLADKWAEKIRFIERDDISRSGVLSLTTEAKIGFALVAPLDKLPQPSSPMSWPLASHKFQNMNTLISAGVDGPLFTPSGTTLLRIDLAQDLCTAIHIYPPMAVWNLFNPSLVHFTAPEDQQDIFASSINTIGGIHATKCIPMTTWFHATGAKDTWQIDLKSGNCSLLYPGSRLYPLATLQPNLTLVVQCVDDKAHLAVTFWESEEISIGRPTADPNVPSQSTFVQQRIRHLKILDTLPDKFSEGRTHRFSYCAPSNELFAWAYDTYALKRYSKVLSEGALALISRYSGSSDIRVSFSPLLDSPFSGDFEVRHDSSNSSWSLHSEVLDYHPSLSRENLKNFIANSPLSPLSIIAFLKHLYFDYEIALADPKQSLSELLEVISLCKLTGVDSSWLTYQLNSKVYPSLSGTDAKLNLSVVPARPPTLHAKPLEWQMVSKVILRSPTDFCFRIVGHDKCLVANGGLLYVRWKWFQRLVKAGLEEVSTKTVVMPEWVTPRMLFAILGAAHGMIEYMEGLTTEEMLELLSNALFLDLRAPATVVDSSASQYYDCYRKLLMRCNSRVFPPMTHATALTLLTQYSDLQMDENLEEAIAYVRSQPRLMSPAFKKLMSPGIRAIVENPDAQLILSHMGSEASSSAPFMTQEAVALALPSFQPLTAAPNRAFNSFIDQLENNEKSALEAYFESSGDPFRKNRSI